MKVIGISTSLNKKNEYFAAKEYASILEKLGAIPILIPFVENVKAHIDMIDGLILIGGYDINPSIYNEEACPLLEETLDIRDEFDTKLFTYAYEKNIPILGVCRGHQLINVLMGGTLYQDLSLKENVSINHREGKHGLKNIDGFLKDIYTDKAIVNSIHHQAVKNVAKDFLVCAYSDDDVIEAMQYTKNGRNIYTVQWHPELLSYEGDKESIKIFEFFLSKINDR